MSLGEKNMRKGKVWLALMVLFAGCSKKIEKKIEQPKEQPKSVFKVVNHYEVKMEGEDISVRHMDGNKIYISIEDKDKTSLTGELRAKSLGYVDITNGKYTSIYNFKEKVRCLDFLKYGKGFYYSELKKDGETVVLGYRENGQDKKIDEGVFGLDRWVLPTFNKIEGNRLLYQFLTKEKGRYFYHIKTLNLNDSKDIKTLYKEEVKSVPTDGYKINKNVVTFIKYEGKNKKQLSLDLETGKVTDITKVDDPAGAFYLGNNRYLLQHGEKEWSVLYDVKENKKIIELSSGAREMISVGDRHFFMAADALVELKDGKEEMLEIEGYQKSGNGVSKLFYRNGKFVILDERLASDGNSQAKLIVDVLEENKK